VEDNDTRNISANRYGLAGITDMFSGLQSLPSFEEWQRSSPGICFYGWNQYARNLQLYGLADASASLGIPFFVFHKEREREIAKRLKDVESLIVITIAPFLNELEPLIRSKRCKVVLIGQYYDETPAPDLAKQVDEKEKAVLEKFRKYIALVLSEFSAEGNKKFMSGYARDFGMPVMTFPWAANIKYHFPVKAGIDRDVIFIGTYCEKAARIEAYLGKVLRHHTHTVIGPDWSKSGMRWMDNGIIPVDEFNAKAPYLYSSHAVSLNIHLFFEVDGFSCNERVFNSIACGGFQVCDNPRRVRDFFDETELVTCSSPDEYIERVNHFVRNPEERTPYMAKALRKIYSCHTYHHRLSDLLHQLFAGRPLSGFCPVLIN